MTNKQMIDALMDVLIKAELTARQYDKLMTVIKALEKQRGTENRN